MAQNLVINGITYNGVESLEMTNDSGEKVLYTEGGSGGSSEVVIVECLQPEVSVDDDNTMTITGTPSIGFYDVATSIVEGGVLAVLKVVLEGSDMLYLPFANRGEGYTLIFATADGQGGTAIGEFVRHADGTETITITIKPADDSGGSGDPTLPAGYVRTGYIRFNDAQIVDTGIVCNQNTKIKVVFTREASTAMYMYGVLSDGNTATVTAYLSSGGAWRFGNGSISRTIPVNQDIIHTAIVQKSGIVSATGTNAYSSVNNFETIGTLTIGATRNANGSVAAAQYIGKIFLFQMWQGDEEVLHLIPVVSADGVYRFYDEVSGTFFDSITDTPLDGGNL